MKKFLAGGAVRNILLGKGAEEFDIVFDGTPESLQCSQNNVVHTVGKSTPNYIVNGHDHTPLAGSIIENLQSRDITINALLMEENGIIHALPQTFTDLQNGRIRHASPTAFFDDPVRVFRAARFTATLPDFFITPETQQHMREAAAREPFKLIAGERVAMECMKAMSGHMPGNFLRALATANCLETWFPAINIAQKVPAGPIIHHGNDTVFQHTCRVMDTIAAMPYARNLSKEDRALAVWMAFCHDLGKTTTDKTLLPSHIAHEKRGVPLVDSIANRLLLPNRWVKAGRIAALQHMKGGRYNISRLGTKVDLLLELSKSGLLAPFCALIMADFGDHTLAEVLRRDMDIFLSVSLPQEWWNKGPESARKLRELRAQALADAKRARKTRNPS